MTAARVVLAGQIDPEAAARQAARQARALGLAARIRIHDGAMAHAGARSEVGSSLELLLEGPEPALRQALAALVPLDDGRSAENGVAQGSSVAAAIGLAPAEGLRGVVQAASGAAALPDPAAPGIRAATAQYHALTRALSDALYAPVRDWRRAEARDGAQEGNRAALVALCEAILPEHLHDNVQRDMGRYPGHAGLSFAGEIRAQGQLRKALKRRCGHAQEFLLEDKANGRAFARALGLRLPVLHQQDVSAAQMILRPNTVIKPLRGGNGAGVFLVDAFGGITRLRPAARLENEAALRAAMAHVVAQGRADRWQIEERLHAPPSMRMEPGAPLLPNDIKIYSFYGRTPLALEVDRNGHSPRYAWHRHPLHRPRTEAGPTPIGKYDDALFDSAIDPAPFFKLAARISRQVPAPFMRIDFLNAADGPVYGEFTPRPGQFHSFHPRADRWLGWECATARARLLADLAPDVMAAPLGSDAPDAARKDFALFRAFVAQALAEAGS